MLIPFYLACCPLHFLETESFSLARESVALRTRSNREWRRSCYSQNFSDHIMSESFISFSQLKMRVSKRLNVETSSFSTRKSLTELSQGNLSRKSTIITPSCHRVGFIVDGEIQNDIVKECEDYSSGNLLMKHF